MYGMTFDADPGLTATDLASNRIDETLPEFSDLIHRHSMWQVISVEPPALEITLRIA